MDSHEKILLDFKDAWDFFIANFTMFSILFIIPIFIIIVGSVGRKIYRMPQTAGTDYLLFLITFDAIAIINHDNMQLYVGNFYKNNYIAVFMILLILKSIILLRYVFPVERGIIYKFFSDTLRSDNMIVPDIINREIDQNIWIGKFKHFCSKLVTWLFILYTISIFTFK